MNTEYLLSEMTEFKKFLKYEKQLSDLTVQKYLVSITRLKDFFEGNLFLNKPLSDATREDISSFLAYLREHYLNKTTIAHYIVGLRTFYSWAMYTYKKDNLFAINFLLRNIIKIKQEKNIPFVPNKEDINKLRDTLRAYKELQSYNKNSFSYKKTILAYAIFELLITTGMRSKELRSLRKKDIDLEGRTILIKFGKGGYQRISLFGNSAYDALQEYFAANNFYSDDSIFPIRQGNVLHYMIKRWARRAQINPRIHIHAFRHYFITESQRLGVPIEIVADQVGHQNLNTTRHYTHFTASFLKEKYEGINI
jgi:integrase/recombinase XerD